MWQLVFVAFCGMVDDPHKESVESFVKGYESQGDAIAAKLRDDSLWKDQNQKATLLKYVRATGAMRFRKTIPALVPHLIYTPYPDGEANKTAEQLFPVMAALVDIGTDSIQPLLEVLKKADFNDIDNGGQRTANVAVLALRSIYNQGGHGEKMAKARIELEIKKTSSKETERLERAAAHPFINRKE